MALKEEETENLSSIKRDFEELSFSPWRKGKGLDWMASETGFSALYNRKITQNNKSLEMNQESKQY